MTCFTPKYFYNTIAQGSYFFSLLNLKSHSLLIRILFVIYVCLITLFTAIMVKAAGISVTSTYIYPCCSASLKVGDMSHATVVKIFLYPYITYWTFLRHTLSWKWKVSCRLIRTSCPSVPWPQPAAEPERRGGSEGTRPISCCLQRSVFAQATAGRARRRLEDGSGRRRRPATLGRAPSAHNLTNTVKSCGRSPPPGRTGSAKTGPSLYKQRRRKRLLLQIKWQIN